MSARISLYLAAVAFIAAGSMLVFLAPGGFLRAWWEHTRAASSSTAVGGRDISPPSSTRPSLLLHGTDGSVFLGDLSTGAATRLLGPSELLREVAAAADAPFVVLSERRPSAAGERVEVSDLYLVDLRDGVTRRLTDDGRSRSGVLAPAAKIVVFEDFAADEEEYNDYGCCGRGLFALDLDGMKASQVVAGIRLGAEDKVRWPGISEALWFADEDIRWARDGHGFAFSRRYGKAAPTFLYWKNLSPLDEPVRIIGDVNAFSTRATDVGSRSILFDDSESHVYRYDLASGDVSPIATRACCARLSPDETRVLLIDVESDEVDAESVRFRGVSVANPDGKNRTSLINDDDVYNAIWGPGGDFVLVTRAAASNGPRGFTYSTSSISIDGTIQEEVFRGLGDPEVVRVGRGLDAATIRVQVGEHP